MTAGGRCHAFGRPNHRRAAREASRYRRYAHEPGCAGGSSQREAPYGGRGFPGPGTQPDAERFVCRCPGRPKHSRMSGWGPQTVYSDYALPPGKVWQSRYPCGRGRGTVVCPSRCVWLMHVAAQVDKRERPESGVAGLQVDGDSRMRGELRTAGSAGGPPAPPPRQAHAEVYEPARGVLSFSPASRWKRLLRPTRHPHANLCGGRETRCARSKIQEESKL